MKHSHTYKQIRLILGDQLNINHSWFTRPNPSVLYVMMEIIPESEYVTHHIQKITGIFLNMRNFAQTLAEQGHQVRYFKINDPDNRHSFEHNLRHLIENHKITSAAFMEPDEFRLDVLLEKCFRDLRIPHNKASTEHFLTGRNDLKQMFPGRRSVPMENFYRRMRIRYNILMEGDKPAGGKWNYDKANRQKLPAGMKAPMPYLFGHDVSEIVSEIRSAGLKYIGQIDEKTFPWPATRNEALEVLEYFNHNLLEHFGTYQDSMQNDHWSLYHSRLSFSLNIKLIAPLEVIRAVLDFWRKNNDKISIEQVEGFIRQILGWREYMRGIYWRHMPEYEQLNFFKHQRPLPSFFWTGNTKMKCIQKAVLQSLEHGYAHHIQRLMVTGNFSLLAGIDPDEVDKWYLGIYTDAFQWVEITNTRGMSQFADGGIVGTKPYISSASYINKMGDYCKNCHYKPSKKTGPGACPFNSLYWRFLAINEEKLAANQRMSMMYNIWHKMDSKSQNELIDQANYYLDYIENL